MAWMVVEFLKDHAAEIFGLFAAGGAGSLVLRHFLRVGEQSPPASSRTSSAESGGISVVKDGPGDISINRHASAGVDRLALARLHGIPHLVTIEVVERLSRAGCQGATLEREFAVIADEWQSTSRRLEQLANATSVDDPVLALARQALAKGDIERAAEYCCRIESDRMQARLGRTEKD